MTIQEYLSVVELLHWIRIVTVVLDRNLMPFPLPLPSTLPVLVIPLALSLLLFLDSIAFRFGVDGMFTLDEVTGL
jgi:hypothetical protein